MFNLKKNYHAVLIALSTLGATQAQAALTLTTDGVALGFTLSEFVSTNPGYNSCCDGPFGIAMDTASGHVMVNVAGSSTRYVFNDVDNQTLADAVASVPSSTFTAGYATAGGKAYGAFFQMAGDGSVDHTLTGVTASGYLGMWGNPVNGHIIATSYSGLIDIDPLAGGGAGSFRVINSGVFGDGVSVSPDGTTAYVASSSINAYDITTGAFIKSYSPGFGFGVDGTGVITSHDALNGKIIANMNSGDVVLIDPVSGNSTLIATGGTRGDYTSPDVSNGTLFLAAADGVYRLSCGADCGIGVPPVPEPETYAMLLAGLGLIGFSIHRKKQNTKIAL